MRALCLAGDRVSGTDFNSTAGWLAKTVDSDIWLIID
jgi:hypothetical protein